MLQRLHHHYHQLKRQEFKHLAAEASGAKYDSPALDFIGFKNNPGGLQIRVRFHGPFRWFPLIRTLMSEQNLPPAPEPTTPVSGLSNNYTNHPCTNILPAGSEKRRASYSAASDDDVRITTRRQTTVQKKFGLPENNFTS